MGWVPPHQTAASEIPEEEEGTRLPTMARYDFSEAPDYYDTGMMGDHWGTGIPVEVTPALLARGQQAVFDQLSGVPRGGRAQATA